MSTAAPSPFPGMAPAAQAAAGVPGSRLASVDVVRGLVILVMIFVNDVAGVHGTPAWMKHVQPPDADGMTFVDVVFPAFLFIVGLAIPLALERRLAEGARLRVLRHVLARTVALLVIGVFMINSGTASPAGPLPRELWTLLTYLGVALVWFAFPGASPSRQRTRRLVRLAGALLLLAMAVLYRGPGEPGLIELRPSWWGILGLIGWAYLVASAVYLAARGRIAVLAGGVVALYGLFMLDAAGWLPHIPLVSDWVAVGSMLGSHAALTLSGAVAGAALLLPRSPYRSHRARIACALLFGALMAAAAEGLHAFRGDHPMFIINKIAATPAWCLWSAAITVWLWAGCYWLLDARRTTLRLRLLELAGQNALLAYILAPVFYAAVTLASTAFGAPDYYGLLGGSFATGFVRSLAFAFFICGTAAWLRRRGVGLRL